MVITDTAMEVVMGYKVGQIWRSPNGILFKVATVHHTGTVQLYNIGSRKLLTRRLTPSESRGWSLVRSGPAEPTETVSDFVARGGVVR